jgi:hypothetical protein
VVGVLAAVLVVVDFDLPPPHAASAKVARSRVATAADRRKVKEARCRVRRDRLGIAIRTVNSATARGIAQFPHPERGNYRAAVLRCPSNRGLAEEAPFAYKDVERVVAVVEQAGLAGRVVQLVPLGVVKA